MLISIKEDDRYAIIALIFSLGRGNYGYRQTKIIKSADEDSVVTPRPPRSLPGPAPCQLLHWSFFPDCRLAERLTDKRLPSNGLGAFIRTHGLVPQALLGASRAESSSKAEGAALAPWDTSFSLSLS